MCNCTTYHTHVEYTGLTLLMLRLIGIHCGQFQSNLGTLNQAMYEMSMVPASQTRGHVICFRIRGRWQHLCMGARRHGKPCLVVHFRTADLEPSVLICVYGIDKDTSGCRPQVIQLVAWLWVSAYFAQ